MQQQWTNSWLNWDVWQKVDFTHQLAMTSSVIGPRRSLKVLSKTKLAPKKVHNHLHNHLHNHYLVVCWQCDPLQLSESQWNHHIWEVCTANRWDAQKIATPTAGIGQQKVSSSPKQHPIACHATNTPKVEQIELWSFSSSAIFTWPLPNYLPLLQASQQLFAGKMLLQPEEGRKFFPSIHQIPKHGYLCYRNKQTHFVSYFLFINLFLIGKMYWL